jgi:hypothetical protein
MGYLAAAVVVLVAIVLLGQPTLVDQGLLGKGIQVVIALD